MSKTYQAFNNKTNRWVKYRKYADGRVRILGSKTKEPTKPYAGIEVG